jgi:hypothetical protein
MATTFHETAELADALATAIDEDPADDVGTPAVVLGGDEAAYGVVRALESYGILTVVADSDPDDIAGHSDAVDVAGRVSDPATDPEAFRRDVAGIVDGTEDDELVAYPCSAAATRALLSDVPDGVLTGHEDPEAALALLDTERVYALADEAGVERPAAAVAAGVGEDGPLDREEPETTADRVGYPVECTAGTGAWLAEAVGADPFVAEDESALARAVAAAEDADRRLVVRERVALDEDRAALAVAGGDRAGNDGETEDLLREEDGTTRPLDEPPEEAEAEDDRPLDGFAAAEVVVRARRGGRHGVACVAETPGPDAEREVLDPASSLLTAAGCEGLAAVRFGVTDDDRAVLLDASPHAPRWLRLVTDAGANLPYVSYVGVTQDLQPTGDLTTNTRWVSFADYLPHVADGGEDHLSDDQWLAYIEGRYHYGSALTAAALHSSDADVTYALVRRELGLS